MNDRLRALLHELAREVLLEAKAPVVKALEETLGALVEKTIEALNRRQEEDRMEPALFMTQAEARRHVVIVALSHTKGNKQRAADLLGVSVKTLREWIRRYDVSPYDWREPTEEPVRSWDEFEREMVGWIVNYYGGNKTGAAEFYGVTRKTLARLTGNG